MNFKASQESALIKILSNDNLEYSVLCWKLHFSAKHSTYLIIYSCYAACVYFCHCCCFFCGATDYRGIIFLEDSVSMPLWLNFEISPLCQTLSKALDMSKNTLFNQYHYQKIDIFRG